MDIQELVRTITAEVLARLSREGSLPVASARPCVRVLAARDMELSARLKKELGDGADVLFQGEDAGGRAPCRHILPFLCCRQTANLAMGTAAGSVGEEVLRLLLSGKEVEVLEFEHRAFAETAPGPLFALYERYEKTLASYGLKYFKRKPPEEFRLRETLVTERDVRRAGAAGASTLAVPASALVTPLAADAAKELHIVISKRL